jgi:CelD/BcsL family acetyltransferase involved in cellulose biosynthesis
MMALQVLESLEQLEELQADWLDLWRSCPRATPFQSPQWLLPWTRRLFGGGQICSLAIRHDDKLIGFAPLFRWGIDKRIVSFLGAGISDYSDVLFAAGREVECVSDVRRFLAEQRDYWDLLDLQELRCGSALLDGWASEACSVCPVLDLRTFPDCMDHKHRIDVRRARSKLSKRPDLQFQTANSETLSRCMDEFFCLHEIRWGSMGEELRQFHEDVSNRFLKTGHLRLSLLRIGGRAVAAIYAFVCGKTLYCYLSGFDPAVAKLSPGAVLLAWVIEQALADGMEEVDFLRQPESYKYLWGARDRTNYMIRHEGLDLMCSRDSQDTQ